MQECLHQTLLEGVGNGDWEREQITGLGTGSEIHALPENRFRSHQDWLHLSSFRNGEICSFLCVRLSDEV